MILDELPPIGFGAMPLSIKDRPDEATARSVLNAAMDEGMTFIDTADVYCLDDSEIGHNERLIASVVKERTDRDRIRIATKGGLRRPRGAWTNDGSPKHIREACEKSLRALEVEQIFLYQFHAPDPTVAFERSVETFAELQRAGKCRFVGISNVSVKQIDAASRIVEVASVQNRLNPFFREAIDDGVVCRKPGRWLQERAEVALGGVELATRPQADAVAVDDRLDPESIPLDLEQPVRVVERRGDEGRQHRRDERRSSHGSASRPSCPTRPVAGSGP